MSASLAAPPPPGLSPRSPIRRTLSGLKASLWRLSVIDGLALFAIVTGLAFWALFGFDFGFEPRVSTRMAILAGVALTLAVLLVRLVGWRVVAQIKPQQLAALVEQHHPELADRLSTAVELADSSHPFSQTLVQHSIAQAETQVQHLRWSDIMRRDGTRWKLLGVLMLTVSVIGLMVTEPMHAEAWYRRMILLESVRYPRQTQLEVVDFPEGETPTRKVARGRDIAIEIRATGALPEKVALQYRMQESGAHGRVYMNGLGAGRYRFVFRGLLEPVRFWVRGGDDYTDYHYLDPVEPPQLTQAVVVATFPSYTGLSERSQPVLGVPVALLKGSTIRLQMATNKPVVSLRVAQRVQTAESSAAVSTPLFVRSVGSEGTAWETDLTLTQSSTLSVDFLDQDGIGPAEPFPVDLLAVEDTPPKLEVKLEGIGSKITPQARIPARTLVTDDYGIKQLEFEYTLLPPEGSGLDATTYRQPIPATLDRLKAEGTYLFDLMPLKVAVRSRLTLVVAATDGDTLSGPHEGRSPVFAFQVVTPEELQSDLAALELNLRRRFEQIVRELKEGREVLGSVPPTPPAATEGAGASVSPVDRARLNIERVLQAVRKAAGESESVAEGFRNIVQQLDNNRIQSNERNRLHAEIVLPMDRLTFTGFPETDERVSLLRDSWQQLAATQLACEGATAAMDQLIADCERILTQMKKLATFAEMVTLLRQIREDQEKVLQDTQNERKKALLDLLK